MGSHRWRRGPARSCVRAARAGLTVDREEARVDREGEDGKREREGERAGVRTGRSKAQRECKSEGAAATAAAPAESARLGGLRVVLGQVCSSVRSALCHRPPPRQLPPATLATERTHPRSSQQQPRSPGPASDRSLGCTTGRPARGRDARVMPPLREEMTGEGSRCAPPPPPPCPVPPSSETMPLLSAPVSLKNHRIT